ncbi:MAG: trimethylamine methyltransferase family protein [Spirochaetes bacterium]|nr:trimethylamine methyltransferase family protein [Spirochaetota bacterium]
MFNFLFNPRAGINAYLFLIHPCISLTQITPGLSGPVTLAGSLALHHAEALIGLIVIQSVNPGTPAIYPGARVTFDMAAGPDTNSHLLDIQNGIHWIISGENNGVKKIMSEKPAVLINICPSSF